MGHEPLMALLNSPHPSGKLARWGLILQDIELVIKYWPRRKILPLIPCPVHL